MPSIKATKIEFKPGFPFRKFKNLAIPLAPRITLICGHNGVGKSTILGLLSSLSGLTDPASPKSYFGRLFDASIADIVYIDHATEVAAPKAAAQLSQPLIHYSIDGAPLVKECSLTRRGREPRARVVARNIPHKAFSHAGVTVGPDAKVPLPTIFLGMVRMLPVGESPDKRVDNAVAETWHADDEAFMLGLVKSVIPGAGAKAGSIAVNRVTHTRKLSTHPAYPYGPRSVSLGQDSLGAIVTALASFHRVKRVLGADYHGGLLVIDELDAGFHPHAIGTLVKELRKAADDLNLQIVATTHSTRLIEAIHPEGPSKGVKGKDSVAYLRNTRAPEYDPDMGLADILQDMDLVPPAAKPKPPEIKVYFEDDEAWEVFGLVTRREWIKQIETNLNVKVKPMPLGIGCSSLALLPAKDPYFKTVVLAVDADGQRPATVPANLVELPGGVGSDGKGLSPERTLVQYIRKLVDEDKSLHPIAWSDARLKKYSTDSLESNLLTGLRDPLDRKAAKTWWREKSQYIKTWGLYEIWAKANPAVITAYEQKLEAAVKAAAKARRAAEELAKRGLPR
ncbi:MAG: AAA family ATPase [Betaproteobacteria bacterium]|jgi:energy-coupling factor transporter ATP-binding protein EcfA2